MVAKPKKAPKPIRLLKLASTPRGRLHLKAAGERAKFSPAVEKRVRMQMGKGVTPNRELIAGLPRDMSDLKKAMGVVGDLHENLSRGYTVLNYGERAINLNEWFLRERIGLNDKTMKKPNDYAPQNIRHREIGRLEEKEKLMDIDELRRDLLADEHVLPEERDSLVENLDFMKKGFKVKEWWPGIKTIVENNERMMDLVTDPHVPYKTHELRPIIKKLNTARATYDRVSHEVPHKGRFEVEHAAKVYPIMHELVEHGIIKLK